MALTIDQLNVRIAADTANLQAGMQRAASITDISSLKMQKSITKTDSLIAKLGRSFLIFAGASGVLGVAKSFVNAASEAENYQVRLKVLLGSVEEGNRVFSDASEFASRVAFEYREVLGAATQLATVLDGGSAQIKKFMPLIADIAAGTGLTIQQAAEQFTRAFSAGIGAADLFRERGVTAVLGFKAGAKVSVEETRKAFENALTDMSFKFRGAADELGKTWTGLTSMIADKWFQLRKKLLDAGLFDLLKKKVEELNDSFQKFIDIVTNPKFIDGFLIAMKAMSFSVSVLRGNLIDARKQLIDFEKISKRIINGKQVNVGSASNPARLDEYLVQATPIYDSTRADLYATRELYQQLEDEAVITFETIEKSATVNTSAWSDQLADSILQGKNAFRSLRDVAVNVFNDIARAVIKAQVTNPLINMVLGGLPGFSGGSFGLSTQNIPIGSPNPLGGTGPYSPFVPRRAMGGSAQAGTPHMVGENGPELFIPRVNGAVIPNGRLGGSGGVTVVQNLNFSTDTKETMREQILQAAPAIATSAKNAVFAEIELGGRAARAVGRRR